ncbi:MAG: hypothetical protein HC904_08535 [Blastochloris sp.]|nr:hypothetical protein [Blastochloris sp.]
MLLADDANFRALHSALQELQARRIAVPRFDPTLLNRGHSVHFRCQCPEAQGLRVDVMTKLRELPGFPKLWAERTTLHDPMLGEVHLLSVPHLVDAKKTQRFKDWPMISALVDNHYQALQHDVTPERIEFWLLETRSAEQLQDLTQRFPTQAQTLLTRRPLLRHALDADEPVLREALDAEFAANRKKIAATGLLSKKKWKNFADKNAWLPTPRKTTAPSTERRWLVIQWAAELSPD